MAENLLNKFVHKIPSTLNDEQIREAIRIVLSDYDTIYSYLIYADYQNEQLDGWNVQYMISQNDDYNVLDANKAIEDITNCILENKKVIKQVIGYAQPPLETMLFLYDPLLRKLSLEQTKRWSCLEYDDAYSICQMVFVDLYQKGYYIHKQLLRRVYENRLLVYLRHERYKPVIVSLDKVLYNDGCNEPLTVSDMTPDKEVELEKEYRDYDECVKCVFKEVKDIVVERIGERQFEQLLRDYANKNTTTWSRKKIQTIKCLFAELGITWDSFRRYL